MNKELLKKSKRIIACILIALTLLPNSSLLLAAPDIAADNYAAITNDEPTVPPIPRRFTEVYDASNAVLTGAAIGTSLDDFTGQGYVDGLPNGSGIEFFVDVDTSGNYGVRLRYTNGTGAAKTVNVYVNGELIRASSLPSTINGTTWNVKLENLKLNVGTNLITYKNDAANDCEEVRFDKISLSRIYEAEDAELSSGLTRNPGNYSGYSGNAYIGTFSAAGQQATFTVDVPRDGEYTMVMRYGAGQTDSASRTFSLYVNGVKIKQARLGTVRDYNLPQDSPHNITLNAGENTITIRRDSTANGGTNDNGTFTLDYITVKPIEWIYAGNITGIEGNGTRQLNVTLDNSVVQITSIGKNSVKVWLEPTGRFSRKYESFAVVNEDVDPQSLTAADKGNYYEIDTGAMLMRLQKYPFKITYLDYNGNIIMENENNSMGWSTDGELIVNNKLPADEQFWGMGEKFTAFNYRGTRMINWATDLGNDNEGTAPSRNEGYWYMANPYYVSSKGYSILFDNTSRTVFDFGKADPALTSFGSYNPAPGGELIYYFTYGPNLKQISKTISDYMGKTFFAPIWSYGNAQCHWGYTQADMERVAQAYRDNEIPIDIMYGDIEWYQNYSTPTAWHPTNYPNPEGMISKIKGLNMKIGLIDDPNITAAGNIADYVYADSKGYFAKDQSGRTKQVTWPWGSNSGLVDFFNPEVRKWWGDQHNMILNQGVEVFWVDMNEPARHNIDWLFWNRDGKAYGTLNEVKNAYATVHNQAVFDKVHENGKRSIILTRSGFTGVHRYSSPWTGDISADYTSTSATNGISGLAEQIRMGTNLSFTGCNYWGFDIGGFSGTLNTRLFKRWIELACFIPMHRFHYSRSKAASEAYTYNATEVSKKYINLRYRLKPYMYSLTADNIIGIGIEKGYGPGGTGVPYARAMVMEYQNDPNTWSLDTQFMAGPSILTAPVLENSDVKSVYLPEGKWYDYFNNPVVWNGGQRISYSAPEDVLPLFVKAGSIIPMYPEMQYWDPKFVDCVTLDVYPTFSDGDFSFVLYEDDGETDNYLKGIYSTIDVNCSVKRNGAATSYKLDIGAKTGSYQLIAPKDYMLQFHRGAMDGLSVKLGGADLEKKASMEELEAAATGYYADAKSETCYVKIPYTAAAASVTLSGDLLDVFKDVYDVTEATLSGAVIGTSLFDYSASGYVDGLADGASITFNVDVPTAGNYGVGMRYTNGTGAAKTISVYVNGVKVRDSSLVPTINGTTWNVKMDNLTLAGGANVITYKNDEANNCDDIRFDKIGLTFIYEAEDAVVVGDTGSLPIITKNPVIVARTTSASGTVATGNNSNSIGRTATGASGDYMGTFYAQGSGSASAVGATGQGLQFNVNVPVAGEYTLVLRYAAGAINNGTARTMNLSVNGAASNISINPTRDWDCWEDFTWPINLNKGANTILFRRNSGNNGEIILDYITLMPVQWNYAGNVQSIAGNGSPELIFNLDNSRVSLKSIAKNSVRVWLEPSASGVFSRKYESFTVINEAVDPQNLSAVDRGAYYDIDAGNMTVRVNKSPLKITYLDKSGKIIYENEEQSMGWTSDGQLKVNSKLPADEQFWGLGEKHNAFAYRGTRQINWSMDILAGDNNSYVPSAAEGRWYMANPYFVSSNGYSILFDNSGRTVFDFGKANPQTTFFGVLNPGPSGQLIYYFTYGPDLKQVNKTFSDYAGKTFFAPEWAYGNIQCKYGYVDRSNPSSSQLNVRPVAQNYRNAQIPLDMIMVDIEWYRNLCSPTAWNTTNFPDPVGLINHIKSSNVRFGVIDDPNITSGNTSIYEHNWQTSAIQDFKDGIENNYFLHGRNGGVKLVDWNWGSHSGLTDFFNPDARKWWGSLHNMITSQGVEGYWLDMHEPCRYTFDWMAYNGFYDKDNSGPEKPYLTFLEFKNAFAHAHAKAMDEYTRGGGQRALLLTRSGYTGGHRYVSPWTGDVSGNYNATGNNCGLNAQIRLGINMSLTGYNYWGYDIGGFQNTVSSMGLKTYKRWIELSSFTPIHRFHSQSNAGDKHPYTHAPDLARKFIGLRYQLKPYMYSLTADNIIGIGIEDVGYSPAGSGGTGYPYTRPMVFEYPNDKNTWTMDSQYMAGPSFLVAPVFDATDYKQVYLPSGDWYDYFNGPNVLGGGKTITYYAPEDELPLFVKAGSIIPMYPVMQYWDAKLVDRVTLDVYPTLSNGDFKFALYEDDGETQDYLKGIYSTTDYNCSVRIKGAATTYEFKIGAKKGSFTQINPKDYMLKFHRGAMEDMSVKLGDTALEKKASMEALEAAVTGYYADAESEICYVKLPYTGEASTITISGDLNEFKSELANGVLTTKVATNEDKVGKFAIFTAVYNAKGVLVYVAVSDTFSAAGEVKVDVSGYPLGEYTYAVFCWDENYIPLFTEKRLR